VSLTQFLEMELCLLKLGSRPSFPKAVRHQCNCQSHLTPTDASYVPFENPTKDDCNSGPEYTHFSLFSCNYGSALLTLESFHGTAHFPGTVKTYITEVRGAQINSVYWKLKSEVTEG